MSAVWFSLSLCSGQHFVYVLQPLPYSIQNDGLRFLVLALNVVHKWFKFGTVLVLVNFVSAQSHSSRIRPINSANILLYSNSVILVTNELKSDQANQIFNQEVLKQNLNRGKCRSSCVYMSAKFCKYVVVLKFRSLQKSQILFDFPPKQDPKIFNWDICYFSNLFLN